jgi:predicted DNA-binding ribbon-helix-helix protein
MGNCVPSRNIMVSGRRTSMRLETDFWNALEEIATRQKTTVSEILTRIDRKRLLKADGAPRAKVAGKNPGKSDNEDGIISLTAAARLFALAYYYKACTEDGHIAAKHGPLRIEKDLNYSDYVLDLDSPI